VNLFQKLKFWNRLRYMRQLRILKQGAWYEIRTRINNREPLFRRCKAPVFPLNPRRLFQKLKFWNSLKWLKQTFAQRYNRADGRIGHIWGDRYWSRIMAGEPPEEEETGGRAAVSDIRVRPRYRENEENPCFPPVFPFPAAPAPG
jgi:hypothetical protein